MVKDPEAAGGERAKVLDFGIAKIAEEPNLKTQAGSVLGTPAYMAPEQCKGASGVTSKSDVYALGVMMYEMLCGQTPFQGEGLGDIMVKHMTEEPPPLQRRQPAVSEPIAALVSRMLAKSPDARPSMRQVIEETERLGAMKTGVMSAFSETPASAVAPNGTLVLADGQPATPQTLALGDKAALHGQTAITSSPGGSSRGKLLVMLGLAASVLLVGAVVLLRSRKTPPPAPLVEHPQGKPDRKIPPADPSPEPRRKPSVPVPIGMVFVPGGRFEMGSTDGEVDMAFKLCQKRGSGCRRDVFERETPRHAVVVRDLFVDQYEVQNEQFVSFLGTQKGLKLDKKKFVKGAKGILIEVGGESGIVAASKKPTFTLREGFAKKPVAMVSWSAAKLYCEAQGKRLLTEAEWELAARGLGRRTYPWGDNQPKCGEVAFGRDPALPNSARCRNLESTPDPVGKSTQDRSPDGVYDLGGNVTEWVADAFLEHYEPCQGACKEPQISDESIASAGKKKNKKGPAPLHVARGGNFNQSLDGCRSAGRNRFPEDTLLPTLGFRCAKAAAPSGS
jgi:formylglycine-generating enzyme required for sulfatase activity